MPAGEAASEGRGPDRSVPKPGEASMRNLHDPGSAREAPPARGRGLVPSLLLAALAAVSLSVAACFHPPHPGKVFRHPPHPPGHGAHVPPGQLKRHGPPPHAKHEHEHGKHEKHEGHGKHPRGPKKHVHPVDR